MIFTKGFAEMEIKHYGEIVAIDFNTDFYGVGGTYQAAAKPVFAKEAPAEILFVHVGRENMTRIGLRVPAINEIS